MESTYIIFPVQPGWMGLVGNEKGLQRIYLPGLKKQELKERIACEFPQSAERAGSWEQAKKQFIEYFSGKRTQFDLPLDLSEATPFQKKCIRHCPESLWGSMHLPLAGSKDWKSESAAGCGTGECQESLALGDSMPPRGWERWVLDRIFRSGWIRLESDSIEAGRRPH